MKRLFLAIVSVMLTIMLTVACGSAPEQPIPEPTPDPTMTPEPTPAPTIEPVPTITPGPSLSHTTGLPFDGPYMPVLAVIENSPAARPQRGLQTADVVYEVPVEGGTTRFVCVFSDTVPEEIMPVRSGRVPFLYIQSEWDAPLMFFGAAGRKASLHSKSYSVYGHELFGEARLLMDGLNSKWKDYFYRVSKVKAPHNVVGKPLLMQALYEKFEDAPVPLGWAFSDDHNSGGEESDNVNLKMCARKSNFVSYTYDAADDVYLRSMGGKPFVSAETGEQVSVKNVIVQYSTYKNAQGRKLWTLVGSGKADYHIGGKLIQGTWERTSTDSKTLFLDANGEQIVLKPGNTWIHIAPEE